MAKRSRVEETKSDDRDRLQTEILAGVEERKRLEDQFPASIDHILKTCKRSGDVMVIAIEGFRGKTLNNCYKTYPRLKAFLDAFAKGAKLLHPDLLVRVSYTEDCITGITDSKVISGVPKYKGKSIEGVHCVSWSGKFKNFQEIEKWEDFPDEYHFYSMPCVVAKRV